MLLAVTGSSIRLLTCSPVPPAWIVRLQRAIIGSSTINVCVSSTINLSPLHPLYSYSKIKILTHRTRPLIPRLVPTAPSSSSPESRVSTESPPSSSRPYDRIINTCASTSWKWQRWRTTILTLLILGSHIFLLCPFALWQLVRGGISKGSLHHHSVNSMGWKENSHRGNFWSSATMDAKRGRFSRFDWPRCRDSPSIRGGARRYCWTSAAGIVSIKSMARGTSWGNTCSLALGVPQVHLRGMAGFVKTELRI